MLSSLTLRQPPPPASGRCRLASKCTPRCSACALRPCPDSRGLGAQPAAPLAPAPHAPPPGRRALQACPLCCGRHPQRAARPAPWQPSRPWVALPTLPAVRPAAPTCPHWRCRWHGQAACPGLRAPTLLACAATSAARQRWPPLSRSWRAARPLPRRCAGLLASRPALQLPAIIAPSRLGGPGTCPTNSRATPPPQSAPPRPRPRTPRRLRASDVRLPSPTGLAGDAASA